MWGVCVRVHVCVCVRVCMCAARVCVRAHVCVHARSGLGSYPKAWEPALSWGGQNRALTVGR